MRLFVFFADRLLRWAGADRENVLTTDSEQPPAPGYNDRKHTGGPPEHWTKLVTSPPPQHWLDLFQMGAPEIGVDGETVAELFTNETLADDATDRGLENLASNPSDEPLQAANDQVLKGPRDDSTKPAETGRAKSWLERLHFPATLPPGTEESTKFIEPRPTHADPGLIFPAQRNETGPHSDVTSVGSSAQRVHPHNRWPQSQNFHPDDKMFFAENDDDESSGVERDETNYPQRQSSPLADSLRFFNRASPARSEDRKSTPAINPAPTAPESTSREANAFIESAARANSRVSDLRFEKAADRSGSSPIRDDFIPNQPTRKRSALSLVSPSVHTANDPIYRDDSRAMEKSTVTPTPPATSRRANPSVFMKDGLPSRNSSVSNSETPIDVNDDRWPALPPPPLFETVDELFLREAELESLRRLDREQRGVLWNE
ncbi:MAG TPA: hypothetical protein VIW64_18165 [Pyrinomonadaceae bacterium]|jgi:hypothetical protein